MVYTRLASAIIIVAVHTTIFELCASLSDVLRFYYAIVVHLYQLTLHFDGVKHVLPIKTELRYKILKEY
jgi:hypothetical protein